MCTGVLKVGVVQDQTTFYQALAATKVYKNAANTGARFRIFVWDNGIVARLKFGRSLIESFAASIYKFAMALFKSLVCVATFFVNKEARENMKFAWKDLGETSVNLFKSCVGTFISPCAARDWHQRTIASHKKTMRGKYDVQVQYSDALVRTAGYRGLSL